MELNPKCRDKIIALLGKGVDIRNPSTLDIGEEVNTDNISGSSVVIYPGCRIYGEKTAIAENARLGYEGPATIDNCQVGPGVELRGGFFTQSVFLDKASMGLGAHVRAGCILEEQANGAHCVGLKQTILFPFVTLGSLINFCDCMMAGGTSRKDHSEVGSSYIHFNFTPEGSKATASLIGDVPRGVMLNQPPIFLGGQGGMVGPLRLGYGNVVAAGTILRSDVLDTGKLIIPKTYRGAIVDYVPRLTLGLSRVVKNNVLYMANLAALEQWYTHVRRPFFSSMEHGELIYAGALEKLAMARRERAARLAAMAEKMSETTGDAEDDRRGEAMDGRGELMRSAPRLRDLFGGEQAAGDVEGAAERDRFLTALQQRRGRGGGGYIETIQGMPTAAAAHGVQWLEWVVDGVFKKAAALLPSLLLMKE